MESLRYGSLKTPADKLLNLAKRCNKKASAQTTLLPEISSPDPTTARTAAAPPGSGDAGAAAAWSPPKPDELRFVRPSDLRQTSRTGGRYRTRVRFGSYLIHATRKQSLGLGLVTRGV